VPCCGYLLSLRKKPSGDDDIPLNAAKPTQGQIAALSSDGDGAVRAAAAFVRLALGDDFDEKDIGFRLPDARELADAIEVRIFSLGPLSGDRELELIGRRAAYLVELAVPSTGDTGFRLCGLILRCVNRRIFFFAVPTGASGGGGEVGGGGGGNCAEADTIVIAMPRTATAAQEREDLAMIYSSGKPALDDGPLASQSSRPIVMRDGGFR
jgi:hypothetical protein